MSGLVRRWSFGRPWLTVAALGVIALIVGASLAVEPGHAARAKRPPSPITLPPVSPAGAVDIHVGRAGFGRPIQAGFVGLSLEYSTVETYLGRNPRSINPVFEQLIRNLAPGQAPVLRIGGDSTDWAWWPVPYLRHPRGVRVTLGPRLAEILATLSRSLGARLILGVDLEVDSRAVAAAEARAFIQRLGRHIYALELGNEPELYGNWPWFLSHGHPVTGRPPGYDFADFIADFSRISPALSPARIAGPAVGSAAWLAGLPRFLAAEPRLSLLSVHAYPLQNCYVPASSPAFPTIGHLLSTAASRGLARRIAPYVPIAHARGVDVRVDEMNTVGCGPAPGVSNTFAAALWSLDALFNMAAIGVDGVNIHTYAGATYQLFTFSHVHGVWRAFVEPEYYGMMMFARAAPPGSRLLRVSGATGRLRAWATRSPDGTHVVLINDDTVHPHVVEVRAAGAAGPATVETLRAASVRANRGVTLDGASFGPATSTGVLPVARTVLLRPSDGAYVLRVRAASAVMLTLKR